jgi:hypothetical protein
VTVPSGLWLRFRPKKLVADLMSIVAICNFCITASCKNREKVSGIMVGLTVTSREGDMRF